MSRCASAPCSGGSAPVDLLARFAARGPQRREILLAVDEFSAVSRRLPIWQLYERARSLGLAVQVSAQSWQGLADDDDERYRIAAAADGGIWLLRTPHPEPVTGLAGTRKLTDTSRRLVGGPAALAAQAQAAAGPRQAGEPARAVPGDRAAGVRAGLPDGPALPGTAP